MTRQQIFDVASKQLKDPWRFQMWLCHAFGIMQGRMTEQDIESLEAQLKYQCEMMFRLCEHKMIDVACPSELQAGIHRLKCEKCGMEEENNG